MDPQLLAYLLEDLLVHAAGGLVAPADPPPERQWISHGEPPMDCAQLTVHCAGVTPQLLDPKMESCVVIHVARVVVTLLRCVTALEESGFPGAGVLTGENRQLAVDGLAVLKHLTRTAAEGTWPGRGLSCRSVKWRGMAPVPPLGGFGGWTISADVRLA